MCLYCEERNLSSCLRSEFMCSWSEYARRIHFRSSIHIYFRISYTENNRRKKGAVHFEGLAIDLSLIIIPYHIIYFNTEIIILTQKNIISLLIN